MKIFSRMSLQLENYAQRVFEIKCYIREARNYKNLPAQIFDVFLHKLAINTSAVDYYRYEFYKKDKNWEEKSFYLGKGGSRYYPWENNKIEFCSLLDNKYLFKILLKGLDLPQAPLIASIGESYEIDCKEKFDQLFGSISKDVVLKPIKGSGGEGIVILNFKNEGFSLRDKPINALDLWSSLSLATHEYIIEERILQKESIAALHPLSLNSFRIVTIKTNDNNWHIAGRFLRLGNGNCGVDNLGSGGIGVHLRPSGETTFAFDWKSMKAVSIHPYSGEKLVDIVISEIKEIDALALKASKAFSFMGTIGWDIALTQAGPIIVEANSFYDCSYFQYGPQGPLVNEKIALGLRKRNIFTRWDKTRVHPKVNRNNLRA